MKIIGIVLFIVGMGFCIAALMGHSDAWAGAALSFFAAVMSVIAKRKK